MRVGRSWFVSTPNRVYPFEFHMRLPLVTWLTRKVFITIGNLYSYHHMYRKYMSGIIHPNLFLLTAKQLGKLFPSSMIVKQRITFMAETLIAIGLKQNRSQRRFIPRQMNTA